jgi:hypothetical protein
MNFEVVTMNCPARQNQSTVGGKEERIDIDVPSFESPAQSGLQMPSNKNSTTCTLARIPQMGVGGDPASFAKSPRTHGNDDNISTTKCFLAVVNADEASREPVDETQNMKVEVNGATSSSCSLCHAKLASIGFNMWRNYRVECTCQSGL